MYKVDKSVDSEARATSFLDVGIHEDVDMTGIEFDVSPNEGNEYLVFHFEKDGRRLNHTEYKSKDTDPEKLANKRANQIKRIKHIITKFISEDAFVIEADDFKEFCQQTINLLGDSYKGKKVRLKVIYSYNNYTSLPNYVPFIESMDVPKEKSRLEILSIDKMVRDKADNERPQSNPFVENGNSQSQEGTDSNSKESTDGLPF